MRIHCLFLLLMIFSYKGLKAQFLVEMVDTTSREGKGIWAVHKKYDHVIISGYFQPQFQFAETKGAKTFNGGNFAPNSSSRMMLRRGRIKFDYSHFNPNGQPVAQVVFQFDGSERGVFIRDFWGRLFENKWQLFAFTTGMFARPFGYELNLSSSDRESPERGRISQTLMKTERDLGMMATFEPRKGNHPLKNIKLDVGVFNGQGLTAPGEYDSYKDFIGRIALKPVAIEPKLTFSCGASILYGGFRQNNKYVYHTLSGNGQKSILLDSSLSNIGNKAPRKYYGADAQWKLSHDWGVTELRAEYWWGTQTATRNSSETPTLPGNEPYFVRQFNGAFFYLLQNIVNAKHQVGLKYDWYDPNTKISGNEIGNPTPHSGVADISFSTISAGYNYYMSPNVKLMLWYEMAKNENTSLPQYTSDLPDNILTCRLQFRF